MISKCKEHNKDLIGYCEQYNKIIVIISLMNDINLKDIY